MKPISKNQLKRVRNLGRKKGRRESGLFLVEGVRLCEAMIESEWPAEMLLVTPAARSDSRVEELLSTAASTCKVLECADSDMQAVTDVVRSQGLLGIARWEELEPDVFFGGTWKLVLALEAVRDPGNVGTILRAADWFGAEALLLGEGCAELQNPKVVRSSAGSLFHVPCLQNAALSEALTRLRESGHRICGAALEGTPVKPGWHGAHDVLVLGNETQGLTERVRAYVDEVVRIPGRGRAESLNVAMAAVALLALARG